MASDLELPLMVTCRQRLHRAGLDAGAIAQRTHERLAALDLRRRVRPGMRIAIGAGSRGIANYHIVMRVVIEHLRSLGASPFIIPAMGSHGGATPEGQAALLAGLHISQTTMGCPVLATMDVVELGRTAAGLPVYLDAHAHAADGLVVVNRIKPHTNFRGRIESGLMKMLAIGTGKQAQADAIHKLGANALRDHMPDIGRAVIASGRVVCGVGLIEDACHDTCDVVALAPGDIEREEARILAKVKAWSPRLPVDELDLLVVERIGKDISGTGMDTNVIGRVQLVDFAAFPSPRIHLIAALGLSEGTHGNAIGMGLCDLISQRLRDGIDFPSTYVNVITGQCPKNAAMPLTLPTDREVVATALRSLVPGRGPREAMVIRIRDTLHLERFEVSAPLADRLRGRDGIALDGEPAPMRFAADGSLL